MAILSSVRSFFGGVLGLPRLPGLQTPNPRTYPAPASAAVNFDTALSVSAWWAGCRLLAETVACLPIHFYRLGPNSKTPDESHPLWYVLNVRPNRYQTKVEFFETLMLNLVTSGNAYVAVERLGNRIVSLMPLMSTQMSTELLDDGAVVHYYYSGTTTRVFSGESIWHVKLFGNGIMGLSPLAHARQSLGISIAAENRLGSVYRNGGKPTGVLMVDKVLKPEQREAIRNSMATLAQGNDDNLFVLEAGMQYQAVSMSPQDIELLESRRFQLEDVARFLGVPSVLINDTAGSTTWGSGIEQIIEGFYKLQLRPYLERLEAGIRTNLMSESDGRLYSVEFDFDALTRMNRNLRFDGYGKGINAGVLTPNEARGMEGWAPMEGGDKLLVNGTMVPLDSVQARPVPTPPPSTPSPTEARMFAAIDALQAKMSSAPTQMQPPKVDVKAGDVHITMPEMRFPDVKNTVNMPETVVNVAAPEVKVDAPVVNIEPAQVTVELEAKMPAPEVTVNLPARRIDSTIQRDASGNIIGSQQIERDA